ncbi:hypothetical protein MNBD_BACTEROID02-704 [hydrothermal vent metagenome]|uniref:Uncharacterized protein n=1 Tax=hydrothermal vent metagenome TaxID=652676 RepID=A0A3B0R9R2_9ZZZZ
MKYFITILLLVFFLSFSTTEAQENQPIIVQNYYWAKEGKIEEVYTHRLYASQVRDSLGLAVGRVLKRIGTHGELSHVIWECEYPSEAARKEDVRKLTASGAFEKVIEKMGTLIEKFSRGVYKEN